MDLEKMQEDLRVTAGSVSTKVTREGQPEPRVIRELPRWRRSSVGLITVHLVIGIVAIGGLLFLALGSVLWTAGRDPEAAMESAQPWPFLAVILGVAGWLSFVYLRRSLTIRLSSFALVLLLALAMIVASALSGPPVLAMDDFNATSGIFSQDSDRFVDISYVGGEYRVLIRDGYYPQIMRSMLDRGHPAVRIEASLRFPSEAHPQTLAGLGCWGGDVAYELVVTPSGEALLLEVISEARGERRPLTAGIQTRSRFGADEVPLRLDCVAGGRGDTAVVAWVGSEQVGAVGVPDGIDAWNAPGFVVYTDEVASEVRFDDFSVRSDVGRYTDLAPPVDLSEFQDR